MGQRITVIEKPSSTPGVLRYELNRNLSGMGHKIYRSLDDATHPSPADELARRLFERGGVASVHVYGNIVTVNLADGRPPQGIKELIEELYVYYGPGVEVVMPEGAAAD
jgi:hypothetical protein